MKFDFDFDFDEEALVEFGVGLDLLNGSQFRLISVDGSVQAALKEMAAATWKRLSQKDVVTFEPSEQYAAEAHVTLPTDHELAGNLRNLHEAANMLIDNAALTRISEIFCYFARFRDRHGARLTAVRRASHFKGLLKKRLLSLVSDALTIVEHPVFKLDEDFDLLIADKTIHILRPAAFIHVGQVTKAILEAVPSNIECLQRTLSFVDFSRIERYARKHPRAARYLASIRAQGRTERIDRQRLLEQCEKTGVEVQLDREGRIVVSDKHILGFLEILDRRRYAVELVRELPEAYVATGRRFLQLQDNRVQSAGSSRQ